jgi:hypothetical protein
VEIENKNTLSNGENNTGLVIYSTKVTQSDISKRIKENHRAKRFMVRFMKGFECHVGEKARWFTLTESDQAIDLELDIIIEFKRLVEYLRRKGYAFVYCWVRHRQGTKKRVNIHVVYFGDYIPQQLIEDWWMKNYKSHRSKMELLKDGWKTAKYLAGYLHGEDFEACCFSQKWVFKGWVGFSNWCKKEFGDYPPTEMLRGLSGCRRKN